MLLGHLTLRCQVMLRVERRPHLHSLGIAYGRIIMI